VDSVGAVLFEPVQDLVLDVVVEQRTPAIVIVGRGEDGSPGKSLHWVVGTGHYSERKFRMSM